jgi:hypothetical protein
VDLTTKEQPMSMNCARKAIGGGLLAGGLLLSGAALAGDSNQVSILQNGSSNSLFTDQSQASGSLLGLGQNPFSGAAGTGLTQSGFGNSASITVSGAQPGGGLADTIGNAFLQQGSSTGGNSATLNIIGTGSVGSVTQNGNSNSASLTASDGARGGIQQDGNGNIAGLSVSGPGVQVLYRQQGDGLTTGGTWSAPGVVTVTTSGIVGLPGGATTGSTPSPITITQTK